MLRCILAALGAGLALGVLSFAAQAEPEPVEYVRICDVYGAGFYYTPGTETCMNAQTGETRRETADGTVIGETPLAGRVSSLEARMGDIPGSPVTDPLVFNNIAISNALQDPDLVAGERFGVRLNWGNAGTKHAFGMSGAIVVNDGFLADGRGRITASGGVAFSGKAVGGRAGLQVSW